jgi:hypothetical protein
MKISSTKLFKNKFNSGSSYFKFVENFKIWISSKDDYSSFYFGKVGGFRDPKLSVGYLKHVHTVPLDRLKRAEWDKHFQRKSKKTSDSYLIYVEHHENILIIDWLPRDAHNLTDYSHAGKNKLEEYKKIAEKFISFETITENKQCTFRKTVL